MLGEEPRTQAAPPSKLTRLVGRAAGRSQQQVTRRTGAEPDGQAGEVRQPEGSGER
jgi:hypothetical protein